MPVRVVITEGTRADCQEAYALIDGLSAEALLADRAYDTDKIIELAVNAGIEKVVDMSFPGVRVVRELERLRLQGRLPRSIKVDNDP